MILPGMGVVSELDRLLRAQAAVRLQVRRLGQRSPSPVIGFFVWGHHMFVSGQSVFAGLVFSFLSFIVAVPSAIKVFNWTATLYKGSIRFDAPMLYALGFIGLFTIGGLTGLFLACLAFDVHVTDTYFVVAHFHYIMVGGMVTAYFGGLHYWWPKITGRMYPEYWARAAAILIFFGFNLTFFPQFILGYLGMPRRYHVYPPEFQVWNVMSSAGASILARRPTCCRCSISAGRCSAAGARRPTRGTRPGWNGRRRRRRRSTISHDDAGGRRAAPTCYTPEAEAVPQKCLRLAPRRISSRLCAQQHEAAQLGIWVFLATEVLFFGGLFLGYAVYRGRLSGGFAEAARHTTIVIGTVNTAILLTSSLTMALAVARGGGAPPAFAGMAAAGDCGVGLRLSRDQGDRIPQGLARASRAGSRFRL